MTNAKPIKKHVRAVQTAALHARLGNIQSARQLLDAELRAAMSKGAQQYIREAAQLIMDRWA